MNYSVCVCAGAVLVLSPALSHSCRKDVLDTIAFARLAADEDIREGRHDSQWFDVYSEVLSACGWSAFVQQHMYEPPQISGGTLSSKEILLELARKFFSASQATLISKALDSLADIHVDDPLNEQIRPVCLTGGIEKKRLTAMVGVVEEGGFLSMVSAAFNIQETLSVCSFESEVGEPVPVGNITRRTYSARFDQGRYDAFRQDTVEWLAAELHAPYVEIGVLPRA